MKHERVPIFVSGTSDILVLCLFSFCLCQRAGRVSGQYTTYTRRGLGHDVIIGGPPIRPKRQGRRRQTRPPWRRHLLARVPSNVRVPFFKAGNKNKEKPKIQIPDKDIYIYIDMYIREEKPRASKTNNRLRVSAPRNVVKPRLY